MVDNKGLMVRRAELHLAGGETSMVNFGRSVGLDDLKRAMNEGDVWMVWDDAGAPLLVRMAHVSLIVPAAAES
ncbi:hypothetical protein CKO28_03560 [Rhodovibrio sodomensis]|uniref:Uncharacterized protein n=1 Tax=Rhodovibrio sodomensis TaxID=1088 RepID=A0ABS1DB09_9PROT|nr:hypothetical protein [Rhodovibrio sodomensis]MBK1667121.1 hypothetical protein [Rhodovibrio sodomensis]